MVQTLTFMSLAPSLAILHHTDWAGLRAAVASQPLWLQVPEIMFLRPGDTIDTPDLG